MAMDFLFKNHIVNGIVPKADAFATSGTTDWINVSNHERVAFLVHTGNATGGTANGVITVNASASAAGTSTTALPFKYKSCASSTTNDTWSALTDATTSGFAMTAGDNYMYWIELDTNDIEAAAAGKKFVALTVTENSNDPIDVSVSVFLLDARYQQTVPLTAIA